MVTVQDVRREMLYRGPTDLGRVVPITSLTTTTAVSSQLASGTVSAERYINKHLWRGEAASSADYWRICTNFAASTGTFTHAGTNYSDTTATGEELEILEHDPYLYLEAINLTLAKVRRRYEVELPAWQSYRNWLDDFSWIRNPADVRKVELVRSPQLTRNRFFANRSYNSSDALVPDFWTLAGSGASIAYSTTQAWKGASSLAITRAGTDCTVSQTVDHALNTGVGDDSLRGETVGMIARVWSAVASQVRLRITDGVDTTNSSYHTGGSGWEELSVSHTVSSTATTLTFSVRVETSNTVAYVGEAAGFYGTVTDGFRRDNYGSTREWDVKFDQSAYQLPVSLPARGFGTYWRITALRPYGPLDWARLSAWSNETTTIDAPLEVMAAGGLAHLYGKLAGQKDIDTTRYQELAARWTFKFERLARAHIAESGPPGLPLGGRTLAYAARRP